MKSLSNWSILGFFVGLNVAILSAVRYFVLYPDLDRAVVYVLLGILIIAVSWLYNQHLHVGNKLIAMEDYLADLDVRKKK